MKKISAAIKCLNKQKENDKPTKTMTILQKHLVFIPLFAIVFVAVFGAIVMVLWNWLMPELFGLPAISFWQAAGLLALCKILLGGIGGGHHGHGHGGHHCGGNKLRERWESMTPEERERIIEAHKISCTTTSDTDCNGK